MGGLQLLNLNRAANSAGYFTTDSQVVLSTDYGAIAQGTTSTNLPATVAGGAAAFSYTFTYTATVDIDGDLAANALTLGIPTAWTAPVAHQDSTVATDTTAADTAGLVSVSDPATEGRTLLVGGSTVKLVLGPDLLVGSSVTLTYANAV